MRHLHESHLALLRPAQLTSDRILLFLALGFRVSNTPLGGIDHRNTHHSHTQAGSRGTRGLNTCYWADKCTPQSPSHISPINDAGMSQVRCCRCRTCLCPEPLNGGRSITPQQLGTEVTCRQCVCNKMAAVH